MINNRIEKVAMIPIMYKVLYENIRSRRNNFENFKYGENIRKQYYRTYKGDKNKPIIFFIHGGRIVAWKS